MRRGPILTLALCIGLPLLLACVLMVYVSSAGVVSVDVRERGPRGDDISLRIPVWLIEPVMNLVPGAIDLRGGADSENWLPLAEAALKEVEKCPDAVFVSVDGPDETVRIEKVRGRLIINVDDQDDHVRVAVPVTLARKMARFAARVCSRSDMRVHIKSDFHYGADAPDSDL